MRCLSMLVTDVRCVSSKIRRHSDKMERRPLPFDKHKCFELGKMGLMVSRTPETWKDLINEKDRVLHWSSEILARVQDNVINEDTFLMDYDDDRLDTRINTLIATKQARVDEMLNKYSDKSHECETAVRAGIEQLTAKLRTNIQKDYQHAYNDIKKFNKKVDLLGRNERKIHFKIQKLGEECAGDARKFQKKLRSLRIKVFNNLVISEKMIFQDKKLKRNFIKKVYDINHKNLIDYIKRVEKLLRKFENSQMI